MTSVVLMKGLATLLICYTKALNEWGPKSEPHALYHKSDPKSVIAQQTVGNSGFIQ